MDRPIRILHLEDDPADRELVQAHLDDAGIACTVTCVQTEAEYEEVLRRSGCDLILADYSLPTYDGVSALRLARGLCPDVPFLFVSGTMGEDAAVEGLTEGATDYVLKQRLSRLGPAVRRALDEAENRRERTRAERELRKLSRAVEQSANTIVITDLDGNIEYANPAFTATTGYTVEECLGKHIRILKTGHTTAAQYKQLWDTITAGRQWRGEFQNRRKDGTLYWEAASISPIKDETGNITHYLAVKEDITELKKTEDARGTLEEQLRHAQKLEALGVLAGGVAHDFNNILNVILGYGELMQMHMAEDDPHRADLAEILAAAERATGLSRALLIFGRKQVAELRPLSLNDVVEEIRRMVLRLIGEDIEVRVTLSPDPLVVMGDRGQLAQVLMNFATNARDAMPGGGVLTLETHAVAMDAEFIRRHGFGASGRYALLSLSDTGAGMDAETRERIFEPFFTTKEVGRGTGLGLSIVYGIVKQHGGFIECSSEPGSGTTFGVYLPLLPRSEMSDEADVDRAPTPRGRETILLAEDDDAARQAYCRALSSFGYTVIETRDGVEAVRQFKDDPDRVELVILDSVMPRKGGKEALQEMRAMRPNVEALFVTGYLGEPAWREWAAGQRVGVVQKPVSPRELLRRIREILDQAGCHRPA